MPGKAGKPEQYQVLTYMFHESSPVIPNPRSPLLYAVTHCQSEKGNECPGTTKGAGDKGTIREDAPTWMDPRLMRIVLTRARQLSLMGHRRQALELLEPYSDFLAKSKEPSLDAEAGARALISLRTSLLAELDPYGKPGGWVPRFSAEEYMQLYLTDRAFSYRFAYAMAQTVALMDTLENAREAFDHLAELNEDHIEQLRLDLGKAYRDYHGARDSLAHVVDSMTALKQAVDAYKAQATTDAVITKRREAIVNAIFTTAGAICSAMPVGQPYLAGVGAFVESVGKGVAAATGEGALDQGVTFLGGFSERLSTTLADQADLFKEQFDDRLKEKYKDRVSHARSLKRQQPQDSGRFVVVTLTV
jgi:hypothetical protein